MKSFVQTSILFLIVCCVFVAPSVSFADLDPVSPFLRGRGTSPTIETLDSNRFTIKPSGRTPRSEQNIPSSIAKPDPVKTEAVQPEPKTPAPAAPAPTVVETEQTAVEQNAPETSPEAFSENDSNFLKRLRVLVLGVEDEELEELKRKKEKISDGENSVEISLAPTYFYYNSSSTYSVRRFSASAPGYQVGISLWVSPYFGIEGDTQSTLGASIDSLTDDTVSTLTINKSRIGLAFRNIDINSSMSTQTLWKISYIDSRASTSSETGGRVSTSSTGVQIAFEAKLPSSPSYTHVFGVSIDPKLDHKEKSGAQGIMSGKSNVTTAISATLGGEVKFNRKNKVYWSLQHRYEKNLFKGDASFADPENGVTPDGLAVDQSLTLFSIGYRWGK